MWQEHGWLKNILAFMEIADKRQKSYNVPIVLLWTPGNLQYIRELESEGQLNEELLERIGAGTEC